MKHLFLLIFSLIFIGGCTTKEVFKIYYDLPREFQSEESLNRSIESFSPVLKGKIIFIDPGHGGEDRRNRGPKGLAIEADVNLRVSLELRNFLLKAGAIVIMSRERDTTVPLLERPRIANESGADIFISIHHNAPGQAGDNFTNYTSTFYHAKETDFEYEPANRDLARYVQRDLAYAMRNSGGLGSFDGTYSDYIIYPAKGFAVLRLINIPGILIEAGFHTHNIEEQRLANEEFNRIQAWGIFRGLGRYFRAGIPEIMMLSSENLTRDNPSALFKLSDPSGIDPSSIKVYIDSHLVQHSFDKEENILSVTLDTNGNTSQKIRIIAANNNGNHIFPYYKEVLVGGEIFN